MSGNVTADGIHEAYVFTNPLLRAHCIAGCHLDFTSPQAGNIFVVKTGGM